VCLLILMRRSYRGALATTLFVFGWVGAFVGFSGIATQSYAQQLLPASRSDIADQERLSWNLSKFPSQPYMNEIYWGQYSNNTPAFFRDSLVQFVARTYYLNRDNSDGSKSQAWAAGGWLAFRSGLIGDVFGVHAAAYTSQPIYAPPGEDGTKLLAPGQNSIGVLGQIYGRIQLGDQEIRGGR
jgi:outer membrane porin, OprD family